MSNVSLLDQLKARFEVKSVPPYGECVVVPGAEFDPDWEAILEDAGQLKTCPRCGFEDPPCWRQNRWVSDVTYCRIEDFQKEYPGLADISPREIRSDRTCYYYRGKKQYLFVYRWPKVLGPQYYPRTRHMFERHVPRAPPKPGQKTLEISVAAPTLDEGSS